MKRELESLSGAELALEILPSDAERATLIGRVELPAHSSARRVVPVCIRNGRVFDLSSLAPTVAQLLRFAALPKILQSAEFHPIGFVGDVAWNSFAHRRDRSIPAFLAPCDLQPVKACGVTYIASVLERLVEERSGGDPSGLAIARQELEELVGGRLEGLRPGSPQAASLKTALQRAGHWSHYLEVAIGPDAESFSKCPPMAAVGFGSDIGVRSDSAWNNPEPELVLAVNHQGRIVGATLGNDVNLRDFEGRSPMLLDKAKDNNASAALGPFIRLFDESFSIEDARCTQLAIDIVGQDGYACSAIGNVSLITRAFEELVEQVMGTHHQYPDGLILFTGTMWVPVDDRLGEGQGFGHKEGDIVTVSSERLGTLCNRVRPAHECEPWSFGLSALIEQVQKDVSNRLKSAAGSTG